jgi:hypothetical protein
MPPQRKLIRFAREKLLRTYVREAAHLRTLAATATTAALTARLLEEAEGRERLAEQLKMDRPDHHRVRCNGVF